MWINTLCQLCSLKSIHRIALFSVLFHSSPIPSQLLVKIYAVGNANMIFTIWSSTCGASHIFGGGQMWNFFMCSMSLHTRSDIKQRHHSVCHWEIGALGEKHVCFILTCVLCVSQCVWSSSLLLTLGSPETVWSVQWAHSEQRTKVTCTKRKDKQMKFSLIMVPPNSLF